MRSPPPFLSLAALCVACAASPSQGLDTSAPLPTEGTLRVLTYNVAGLPDGLSSAEGALLDRMPAIQALLDDYDLVGIQEDFDETAHAALTEGTGHAEVRWFSAPLAADRVYGSGLSQLLPQAASTYREEHYEQCSGVLDGASDCLASKGFQTSTLLLGGHPLDVINTHHEAGGGADDNAARLSQVDAVLAAVETHAADRAVLMTGDFNLRPSDPDDAVPLARYDDAGLLRACDLLGCPEPDHIDQIRLRSSAALSLEVVSWERVTDFVTADGVDLSDHPAIAAEVAWAVEGG